MLCHLPFLFPLAGLALFALLPFPAALIIYVPLTLLSLAIGVPALRAMHQPVWTGAEGMRGKPAVVIASRGRSGLVACEGELWAFRSKEPVVALEHVDIVAVDGLTAIVQRQRRGS